MRRLVTCSPRMASVSGLGGQLTAVSQTATCQCVRLRSAVTGRRQREVSGIIADQIDVFPHDPWSVVDKLSSPEWKENRQRSATVDQLTQQAVLEVVRAVALRSAEWSGARPSPKRRTKPGKKRGAEAILRSLDMGTSETDTATYHALDSVTTSERRENVVLSTICLARRFDVIDKQLLQYGFQYLETRVGPPPTKSSRGTPAAFADVTRAVLLLSKFLTNCGMVGQLNARMADACRKYVLTTLRTCALAPPPIAKQDCKVLSSPFFGLVSAVSTLEQARPELAEELLLELLLPLRDASGHVKASALLCVAACNLAEERLLAGIGIVDNMGTQHLVALLETMKDPSTCSGFIEQHCVKQLGAVAATDTEVLLRWIVAAGSTPRIAVAALKKVCSTIPNTNRGLRQLAKLLKNLSSTVRLGHKKSQLTTVAVEWLSTATDEALFGFPSRIAAAVTMCEIVVALRPFGIADDSSADTLGSVVHRIVHAPGSIVEVADVCALLAALNLARSKTNNGELSPLEQKAHARAALLVQTVSEALLSVAPGLITADTPPQELEQLVAVLHSGAPVEASKRDPVVRGIITFWNAQPDLPLPRAGTVEGLLHMCENSSDSAKQFAVPFFERCLRPLIAAGSVRGASPKNRKKSKRGDMTQLSRIVQSAARLGCPCAIEAIEASKHVHGMTAQHPKTQAHKQRVHVNPIEQLESLPSASSGKAPSETVEAIAQEALAFFETNKLDARQVVRLLFSVVRIGFRRGPVIGPLADAVSQVSSELMIEDVELAVAAVSRADSWPGLHSFVSGLRTVIIKHKDRMSVSGCISLANEIGRCATAHEAVTDICGSALKPLIPIVLRNAHTAKPRDGLRFVAACARCNISHATLYQTVFGTVADNRNTMPLEDVLVLVDVVQATKANPELHESALRLGRSIVGAVVGGVARRGALDLSGQVLEPLVGVLALVSPHDRVCLDVFAACVQRRREVSLSTITKALQLAASMPALPTSWSTLAEFAMRESAKPGGPISADEAVDIWALCDAGGLRDVHLVDAVEHRIAQDAHELSASAAAKLFGLSYRLHRSQSPALPPCLANAPGYAEQLSPAELHTILGSMFALRVKNRRALTCLAIRAAHLVDAFSLPQLRTVSLVVTKARAVDDPVPFANAMDRMIGRRIDANNAVACLAFIVTHELADRYAPLVHRLVQAIQVHRDFISTKVQLASQAWDAISALHAQDGSRSNPGKPRALDQQDALNDVAPDKHDDQPTSEPSVFDSATFEVSPERAETAVVGVARHAQSTEVFVPADLFGYFERLSLALPVKMPEPEGHAVESSETS